MMARFEMKLLRNTSGSWILETSGNRDYFSFQLASAAESSALIEQLVAAQAQTLVLDLSAVKQLDSLGLQLLLVLHKQLATHEVQIVLRQANTELRQVLRIMQFDQLFNLEVEDN